ncbi:MAG: alpha/beta fold hydrolase [Acidimicrobiales bacterium]
MSDDAVHPYEISIADEVLDDLTERLVRTRWPDEIDDIGWGQGIPLAYVRDLCDTWLHDYDWRERERLFNGWPQFRTTVDGIGIHFLHVTSPHREARPMIMSHGWPGSFADFQKVIDRLVDPTLDGGDPGDAFHLVIPSLPGYGFSDRPRETGWGKDRIARAWATLMDRLGYPRYLAQGGDWGTIVTTRLAQVDPDHCAGIHLLAPLVLPDPATMDDLTEAEQSGIAGMKNYEDHESGYSKQQATRPQTLAYGLTDSPVGQLAWNIEKFWAWTDCDGHPETVFTRTELLDNATIYWVTATGGSSGRLYWESFDEIFTTEPVTVPMGATIFPKEVFRVSRRWAEQYFENIVHWTTQPSGGHFAAAEQPDAFVDDVRTWAGIVW